MKLFSHARLIIFLLLLMTVTGVRAAWEENWLLGISGGYAERDENFFLQLSSPGQPGTRISRELEDNGFIWEILGGYQARCKAWLLGAELNVGWQDISHNRNLAFLASSGRGWAGAVQFVRDTTIGLSGRLGYQVLPYLLSYGRVGIETSRDRIHFVAATNPVFDATDFTGRRRSYRYIVGVGGEMPIACIVGLSVRMEYDYVKGKQVSGSGPGTPAVNTTVFASIKPSMNFAKISLIWNFV